MLTARTVGGVVTAKDKQWLTLLSDTGKKEKVKYTHTDLKIGDEVLIAHNHVTGHIAGVYGTTEIIRECLFINPTRPEPIIMEDDPEFDFMEWECSRSQDFMRFLE